MDVEVFRVQLHVVTPMPLVVEVWVAQCLAEGFQVRLWKPERRVDAVELLVPVDAE